jgi:hypothetical protein
VKIVFVGNFEPAHSTENDIRWTLEDMGHEVVCCQESRDTTDRILEESKRADMMLYVHTHGWVTPGSIPMREVIKQLHRIGRPTVAFHLDYWYGLDRAKDVGNDAFWFCDYVFTADGDPRTQDWFKSMGINHFWSAPAVVKRDCYITPPVEDFKQDVLFVGSSIYHKEWPYRAQLVEWLHKTYGDRFTHYGNGGVRSVRGHELNQIYASSKVVVGDSLCLGFNHENYWSDRVYETRGRGGVLIHPEIKGLDTMLVKYKYGDFDELKRLIDYYLQNGEQRESLRKQMLDYVKNHHTYHNRFEQIFKIVGLKNA